MVGSLNFCVAQGFKKKRLAKSISAALLIPVMSSLALAETVEEGDYSDFLSLEEMTVTATKREQFVMNVPLAISVLSGDFIRKINLNDVKDVVKFSPGVTGNSQDSFLDELTVRGIQTNDFGNGADAAVGIYKNGNYQGRNGSAVTSLFDMDRIEVLRGPQGFLFGRGAIAGAISAHTVKANAEQQSGYVEIDSGERGVLVGEGAINVPLTGNLGARVAFYHSEEDGWLRNLADGNDYLGHDKDALRLSLNYSTDKIKADLILEYEDREQGGSIYRALDVSEGLTNLIASSEDNGNFAAPASSGSNNRQFNADLGNGAGVFDRGEIYDLSLKVDYQLDNMVLTSITGYRDHEYAYAEDFDGTTVQQFYYEQDQQGDYFQQELRLTSDTDEPLNWYAGVSYYQEDIDTNFLGQQAEEVYCGNYYGADCNAQQAYYGYVFEPSSDGLINDRNRTVGDFKGYAAYVDFGYEFSPSFNVAVGVRYTKDKKNFSQETSPIESVFAGGIQAPLTDGAVSSAQEWDNLTWRVVGSYNIGEQFVFASVSTGAKSGGFDSFRLNTSGLPNSFDEETVTSYELGYKGNVWGGKTQLTGSLFYYEYKDLQLNFQDVNTTESLVGNVGDVDGYGLEASSVTTLTDNATFALGASWLDSEVGGYQQLCDPVGSNACEGLAVESVPEWTFYAAISADYPVDGGKLQGTLTYSAEDETFSNIQPNLSLKNEGVKEVQLSVGYASDDNWSLNLYVENLTNEDGYDSISGSNTSAGDGFEAITGVNAVRPRTIGVRLGYKF